MRPRFAGAALTAAALAVLASPSQAQTTLQLVEVITSPQRTEVLRSLIDEFEAATPGVAVEITSLPWGQAFAWIFGHDGYHTAQIRNMPRS